MLFYPVVGEGREQRFVMICVALCASAVAQECSQSELSQGFGAGSSQSPQRLLDYGLYLKMPSMCA